MPPNINDLEYAFFGGSPSLPDAAYAYYLAAKNAGVTGLSLITAAVSGPLAGVAGTGVDGVANFDGTNTLAAFTSTTGSAPNLVYTLTRDIYVADGSGVATGKTLNTAGFRIFCSGTWTDNGFRQNNGGAASGTNNGTGGTVAGAGTLGVATAGASGATGVGGVSASPSTPFGTASVSNGGAGGAGGTAGGTAGGGNAPPNPLTAAQGGDQAVYQITQATLGVFILRAGGIAWGGGRGGSAGAGDSVNVGGGGGGGGGVMTLACYRWAGNGTVGCAGGAGGTPTTAGSSKGVGGGGGGGGGLSIVTCHVNAFVGTHSCLGGVHGNGLNGAGGTGAGNGSDGGSGTAIVNVF